MHALLSALQTWQLSTLGAQANVVVVVRDVEVVVGGAMHSVATITKGKSLTTRAATALLLVLAASPPPHTERLCDPAPSPMSAVGSEAMIDCAAADDDDAGDPAVLLLL